MTDKELGTAAGDIFTTQIAKAIQAQTGGNVEGKLPEWWAEFIDMVLAELQSAGRLLADDETRFTAELAEDLRMVLDSFGFNQVTPEVIQAIEAAERLNRALFPATEPAEVAAVNLSPTAAPILGTTTHKSIAGTCNWCKRSISKHLSYMSWFHTESGNVYCNPAPAEPAEEETKADPFKALHDVITFSSMDFGSASDVAWMYGIVVGWDNDDPDEGEHPHAAMWSIAQRFNWPHRKVEELRNLRAEWVRRTSSPVEEETKAECVGDDYYCAQRDSAGNIRLNCGRGLLVAEAACTVNDVKEWWIRADRGSKWERQYQAALDLFDREAASSPVVPAPTETGPWQDWPSLDAIPADVRTVWDKSGDEWRRRKNGGWKFRSHRGEWQKITLPLDDYIDYAPFTTAAVAVWDPELGTRNDWTPNEGAEQ